MKFIISLCLVLYGTAFNTFADDKIIALVGAKAYPISSDPIDSATIIIKNDKIIAVGKKQDIEIPTNAKVIALDGKVLMPGLIDTHSHIGVAGDHNERSAPVNPQLRIIDSFWHSDPRIKVATSGGITSANVMPGSGNVIGGQTLYIKLKGNSAEEMKIKGVVGGMKFANGENPKGRGARNSKPPTTRMATAALARQAFYDAKAYQKKKSSAKNKQDMPSYDIGKEALQEVLTGKRMVHHHTHRTDDIMTVLRLKDEFKFRLVIQHGLEAYKIADELAKHDDIFVSYAVVDSPGGKHEAFDVDMKGAGILEKAGLEIALHSDDWIIESRFLLRTAALAVRGGMSKEGALRALTINPAKMMDIDDRVGSLEKGKEADIIVLSGDPFSVYTHVEQTWIEGDKVFDRSNPEDRLYATGGYKVAKRYPVMEGK